VEELTNRHGADDLVFTFSRYKVASAGLQAIAPRSPVLKVPAHDVTEDWLAQQFAELRQDQEMALHSSVEHRGHVFHIPMVDFIGRPDTHRVSYVISVLVSAVGLSHRLAVFDTGRSFHGYFTELLPAEGWPHYLGQLLLCNEEELLCTQSSTSTFISKTAAFQPSHTKKSSSLLQARLLVA
jgi:hypothetical protein